MQGDALLWFVFALFSGLRRLSTCAICPRAVTAVAMVTAAVTRLLQRWRLQLLSNVTRYQFLPPPRWVAWRQRFWHVIGPFPVAWEKQRVPALAGELQVWILGAWALGFSAFWFGWFLIWFLSSWFLGALICLVSRRGLDSRWSVSRLVSRDWVLSIGSHWFGFLLGFGFSSGFGLVSRQLVSRSRLVSRWVLSLGSALVAWFLIAWFLVRLSRRSVSCRRLVSHRLVSCHWVFVSRLGSLVAWFLVAGSRRLVSRLGSLRSFGSVGSALSAVGFSLGFSVVSRCGMSSQFLSARLSRRLVSRRWLSAVGFSSLGFISRLSSLCSALSARLSQRLVSRLVSPLGFSSRFLVAVCRGGGWFLVAWFLVAWFLVAWFLVAWFCLSARLSQRLVSLCDGGYDSGSDGRGDVAVVTVLAVTTTAAATAAVTAVASDGSGDSCNSGSGAGGNSGCDSSSCDSG